MRTRTIAFLLCLCYTTEAATITAPTGVQWEVKRLSNETFQFHVHGPKTLGYAALGIGSGMTGAIMFVSIPRTAGVDLYMASAPGHVNPQFYSKGFPILEKESQSIEGDSFDMRFLCHYCTTWDGGNLEQNTRGSKVSFIRAEGQINQFQASQNPNSLGLRFHNDNYGVYKVDMESDLVATTHAGNSRFWIPHAILATLGFFAFYYIGLLFAGFFRVLKGRVRYHYGIQLAGTVIGLVGIGLGIKAASGHHFRHAHTQFGLAILLLIFSQIFLGMTQHLFYKHDLLGTAYSITRLVHRLLGAVILSCVAINIGLGLGLRQVDASRAVQIAWFILSLTALIGLFATRVIFHLRQREVEIVNPAGTYVHHRVPNETAHHGIDAPATAATARGNGTVAGGSGSNGIRMEGTSRDAPYELAPLKV